MPTFVAARPRGQAHHPLIGAAVLGAAASLSAGCPVGTLPATPARGGPPLYAAASVTPTATPEPTAAPAAVQSGHAGGVLPAEIVPEDQVALVAETGGRILALDLAVGQRVSAGDIVARIDSSLLEAERALALTTLENAQAQLDLLRLPANEADIEAARAVVAAEAAAYARAVDGPSAAEIALAEAELREAESTVAIAQAAYDQVAWNPMIESLPETRQLELARLALDAAQARYDQLTLAASEADIAAAYARLADTRARLRRLEDGPDPVELAAAAAQVRQAETALYLAQLQLDKAVVRAPIDGIVARVDLAAGALASPGARLGLLMTPAVKVETQVDEARMARLAVGQTAAIRVSAFPGHAFTGTVAIIAPQVDPVSRTVTVTVRPGDDDAGLAPGMSATVEFPALTADLP